MIVCTFDLVRESVEHEAGNKDGEARERRPTWLMDRYYGERALLGHGFPT